MRTLVSAAVTTALAITMAGLTAGQAYASVPAVDSTGATESYMFTVQAARGSTTAITETEASEQFRLTITGVSPVTMFADRPFRDASLITPRSLEANWATWFADSAPNAVLTYARPGKAPGSFVVELTNPVYHATTRSLSFTAIREARAHDPVEKSATWTRLTTPSTMAGVSLFIDPVDSGNSLSINAGYPGEDA